MSVVLNKFNIFVADLAAKVHNLDNDVLKVALCNAAPNSNNTVLANCTQISQAGGYLTGGLQATQNSGGQANGLYTLILNSIVFTANASMGPFRWAVLYNSTATSNNLIGWYDYGSNVTLSANETFSVQFTANGVLTLQ
jgi:hypothetical protein